MAYDPNDDKFSALWAQCKERFNEARTKRKDPDGDSHVQTFAHVPLGRQYGGDVFFGEVDDDIDTGTNATMYVSGKNWSGKMSLTKGDMVNLAAELMAVAHECEEVEHANTEQQ